MNISQKSSIPKYSPKSKSSAVRLTLCLLFGLLIISFAAALVFGSAAISIRGAVASALNFDFSSPDFRIFFYVRLPRAVSAVLAGSALAVSGVIIQAVLNNPMASPNIIGVNSGAGLGAIIMIALFPSLSEYIPLAAFAGAVLACLLIYAIASRTNAGRLTITLIGIAVSSILSAGINTVKTLFPDAVYDAESFMIGGLSGMSFAKLTPACYMILVALLVALLLSGDIDILSLGSDSARSLGMNVKFMQLLLLTLASILAGAAVSFAGLLGFVGLIVPHIMRQIVGGLHRHLIPSSALGGAILVLICDTMSRAIFAPYELPVGIILSLLGGPFFIMLVLVKK